MLSQLERQICLAIFSKKSMISIIYTIHKLFSLKDFSPYNIIIIIFTIL